MDNSEIKSLNRDVAYKYKGESRGFLFPRIHETYSMLNRRIENLEGEQYLALSPSQRENAQNCKEKEIDSLINLRNKLAILYMTLVDSRKEEYNKKYGNNVSVESYDVKTNDIIYQDNLLNRIKNDKMIFLKRKGYLDSSRINKKQYIVNESKALDEVVEALIGLDTTMKSTKIMKEVFNYNTDSNAIDC